jgi:hypothetical protein
MESEGDGVASLGVRLELLALKSFLTMLKGDMDSGIKRVEEVLGSLELCGLNMGSRDGHRLGRDKDAGCKDMKPKRKNRKKNKKKPSGAQAQAQCIIGKWSTGF